MNELPGINDAVVIRDLNGRSYASRVEDVTSAGLTVARPFDLSATDPVDVDDDLVVTWTCPAGVAVLPVRLDRSRTVGRLLLWDVEILGDTWMEQRRAHVRVRADGPVILQIVPEDPDDDRVPDESVPGDAVLGTGVPDTSATGVPCGQLIDIGEAALQCSITNPALDELLAVGVRVVARFQLRDTEFVLPGRAIIRRPACLQSERARLVVCFEHSDKDADALRRQVFAQQVHIRHLDRARV